MKSFSITIPFIFLFSFLLPAVANGPTRSASFERAAREELRVGDLTGQKFLRTIGRGEPILPPELTDEIVSSFPEYVEKYNSYRNRLSVALEYPSSYPEKEVWRVHRAEADLHLAAYEMSKDKRGSISLIQKCLADARWALNHTIVPIGSILPEEKNPTVSDVNAEIINVVQPPEPPMPPQIQLSVEPRIVSRGQPIKIAWSVMNAEEVVLNGIDVNTEGEKIINIFEKTIVRIAARGRGGMTAKEANVEIASAAPEIFLSISPNTINPGEYAELSWNVFRGTTFILQGETIPLSGKRIIQPRVSGVIDAVAYGPGGMSQASTGIRVISQTRDCKPVSAVIYFDFNSDAVREENYNLLRKMLDALNSALGSSIRILGYTDSVGSENFNSNLSIKRANAVKNILVRRFGLPEKLIRVEGLGENNPVEPNEINGEDNPKGRSLNRRAEIYIE